MIRRVYRPLYILLRLVEMIGSVVSRLFNALVLKGSTHQTTSARVHIERWHKSKAFINFFFFWQKDHCRWAWEQEVKEALRTLEKSKGL